jgi:hypothetical protein
MRNHGTARFEIRDLLLGNRSSSLLELRLWSVFAEAWDSWRFRGRSMLSKWTVEGFILIYYCICLSGTCKSIHSRSLTTNTRILKAISRWTLSIRRSYSVGCCGWICSFGNLFKILPVHRLLLLTQFSSVYELLARLSLHLGLTCYALCAHWAPCPLHHCSPARLHLLRCIFGFLQFCGIWILPYRCSPIGNHRW